MFAIDLLDRENRYFCEHRMSRQEFCKSHIDHYILVGVSQDKQKSPKVNSRYSSIDFFVTSFDLKSFCGSYPDDWRAKEKELEDKAVEKKVTFFPKNENEIRGTLNPSLIDSTPDLCMIF